MTFARSGRLPLVASAWTTRLQSCPRTGSMTFRCCLLPSWARRYERSSKQHAMPTPANQKDTQARYCLQSLVQAVDELQAVGGRSSAASVAVGLLRMLITVSGGGSDGSNRGSSQDMEDLDPAEFC